MSISFSIRDNYRINKFNNAVTSFITRLSYGDFIWLGRITSTTKQKSHQTTSEDMVDPSVNPEVDATCADVSEEYPCDLNGSDNGDRAMVSPQCG